MMQTAILYFGSFNPVHNGHIALAKAVAKGYDAEVWFVLSPQNPFKQDRNLWPEETRGFLLKKALENEPALKFCDVELRLSKPSYTINTLRHLQAEEPQTSFFILMGEDNLAGLHRWKEIDEIMTRCRILVYPRKEKNAPLQQTYPAVERFGNKITLLKDLPLLDISSTQIRQMLAENKDISALVPWPTEALGNLPVF